MCVAEQAISTRGLTSYAQGTYDLDVAIAAILRAVRDKCDASNSLIASSPR
jgi:hypothetical protein